MSDLISDIEIEKQKRTCPSPSNSIPNFMIRDFGAYFSNYTDTFMTHPNASMMVMQVSSTDSRMACLHEKLMASEWWTGNKLGFNSTFGPGPGREFDRHSVLVVSE
jgi:hypothetical protein